LNRRTLHAAGPLTEKRSGIRFALMALISRPEATPAGRRHRNAWL
jgi:hypothetical protein